MAVITLKEVAKTYQSGSQTIQALHPTSLSIERGEMVAIVGPSGSGKSTLLTIIGGLLTPSEGEVIINGINYSNLSEKKRARLRLKDTRFILQASNLVPYLTVHNQLRFLDTQKDRNMAPRQVDKLFEELDITDLKNKYPSDLSGGERQRVAIAKALFTNPAVILADEPTASLDSERAFDVVAILRKATEDKNTATVVVTHDRRLLPQFDTVYEMTDGVLKKL